MLFKRICQITVGDPKQNNIIFDERFRISFDINKNLLSTPKISKVDIYNLTRDSREQLKEILQKNSSGIGIKSLLTIYAGYEEGEGLQLLYKGNIKHIHSRKDPPDVITTISCVSSFGESYCALSWGAIQKDEVWEDFTKKASISIDSASDTSNSAKLAHGWSHVGTVKDGIDNYAKQSNSTVAIEDNKIKILPKGKSSKDSVVDVSIDTGLIGSPEKIESQGTDTDTNKTKDGWKIKMFLQPKIRIGGRINITSEAINGIYIADSINHIGDTAHGDWQTVVETKETQS